MPSGPIASHCISLHPTASHSPTTFNDHICSLLCHPRSGLHQRRSHRRSRLRRPSPSLDVAASQLRVHSHCSTAYSEVNQGVPSPCGFNSSFRTQKIKHLVERQVQGAVRWDLVKVNDPLLKKAPPDSVEFGSDRPSCHAST